MIELKEIKKIDDFKKLLDIQKSAWGFRIWIRDPITQ